MDLMNRVRTAVIRKRAGTGVMWTAVTALLLAFSFARCAAAQVTVFAWQENGPEGVTYHYRVTNQGPEGLLGLEIGQDELTGRGLLLTTYPVGFVEDEEAIPPEILGMGFPIPASSVGFPPGWNSALVLEQESSNAALHYFLHGGTPLESSTLRGFRVLLPQADADYLNGPWAGILKRGIHVQGKLEKDTVDAPAPTATVSGSAQGCDTVSMTINSVLSGNGPWSIRWNDGYTQQPTASQVSRVVQTSSSAQYWIASLADVNRTGSSSGVATATVSTKPSTPAVTASGPTTFCAGNSVTLSAPAGFTYSWSTGATSSSIVVMSPGSYGVTVTNANGCSASSVTTNVTVNAATAITQQPQTRSIAKNTVTTLSVAAAGSGTLTYQWFSGSAPSTTKPISGATGSSYTTPKLARGSYGYWVRVTGGCGVVNSTTATITAN